MNSNIRWRVMLLQGVMILVLAGAAVIAYGAGTFSHNQIKGRGRRGSRVGSILVALGLVAAFAVPAVNAAASNEGDVWLENVGQSSGPGHEQDPHLACQDINLWGDKLANSSGTYIIDGWSPSGSGAGDQAWPGTAASPGNASWSYNTGTGGNQVISVISVSQLIANAVANGDSAAAQAFHFKLDLLNAGEDLTLHKTFWVDCGLPSIGTTPSAGGTVGTVINDTATVSGGNSPTGDVTFSLYAPGDTTCDSAIQTFAHQALSGLNATSGNYTTAAVGTYRWTATYNGDANNLAATSGCQDEQVTTTKAQPNISTTPSAGGTVGTVINDTATVSGGYSPTGDVTFNLYAPGDTTCVSAIQTFANVTLSGLTATSGNYTTAAVGTYRWTATYNGDANNLAAPSGCQDEQVTTTAVPPGAGTLGTQQGAGTLGASVTLPRAGAGPQHPVGSAAGGGGPSGAVGIMSILLLALVVSVLFVLRRRHGAEMGQPGA